ncbi:MAG: HAMP domain-containing protein [[Clostridium] nexile]
MEGVWNRSFHYLFDKWIAVCFSQENNKTISQLAEATDKIALGNYGEKVNIGSSDYEITALSESFNSMSFAVEQKIKDKEESKNVIHCC